jgi:hypothetical protein
MTTEQQEIVRNQIEGYRQLYLKDGNPILVNFRTLVPKLNKPERGNTGTGSCFVEKEIELQAEMSVAQFFCKFLYFDLVGKNYFTIFAGGKGI